MTMESYEDVLESILRRAYEDPTDTSGDWYEEAGRCIIEAFREIVVREPWLELIKDPPGALVTVASIDSITATAAAGTSVAATLSASQSVDLTGYKLRPTDSQWYSRVTAHTPPSASVTLDAVPEALVAAACLLYKDEYDLASDLGIFVNGLWLPDGSFCELVGSDVLTRMYGNLPDAQNTPAHFCRLTKRKIRFSGYPTTAKRWEYPYVYEPSDPSGSDAMVLSKNLVPGVMYKALSLLLGLKLDAREDAADKRGERVIEEAVAYETRRKVGMGGVSARVQPGPYGDTFRSGGYGYGS